MKTVIRFVATAILSCIFWVAGFDALNVPDGLPFWRVVTGITMVALAVIIWTNFFSDASQMDKDGE